jgi:hypothetical protein
MTRFGGAAPVASRCDVTVAFLVNFEIWMVADGTSKVQTVTSI